jgi:hypothetical protein
MLNPISRLTRQRTLLSTHAAAAVATLLLTGPWMYFLIRTNEPITPALVAAGPVLFYFILFAFYSALAQAAAIRTVEEPPGQWVFVVSAFAGALVGIPWLVWVWGMHKPLASPSTYLPLVLGAAGLWAALAAGAIIQSQLNRKDSRRFAV